MIFAGSHYFWFQGCAITVECIFYITKLVEKMLVVLGGASRSVIVIITRLTARTADMGGKV